MKYVFGPVPSRRLGRSLGIDTVPLKTCNWNCVYCQLGRSTPVVHERRAYLPRRQILDETAHALATIPGQQYDWITFVASGEGTLHSGITELVSTVKQMTDHPVAVITNGSLLHRAELRAALAGVDAVLPTLDAGTEDLYHRFNRPHPSLTYPQHMEGLWQFARMERRARLWIEVMLVAGLNDTPDALHHLGEALRNIAPDEIHLTLPTRCPAEDWVEPPNDESLVNVQSVLGPGARLTSTYALELAFDDSAPVDDQIVNIVSRHPMRVREVDQAARKASVENVRSRLDRLHHEGRLELVDRGNETFACRRTNSTRPAPSSPRV